jgi:hypothetical protein
MNLPIGSESGNRRRFAYLERLENIPEKCNSIDDGFFSREAGLF